MSKRKKRGPRQNKDDQPAAGAAADSKQLPRPNPPKRNPAMLGISIALFVGWFLFLFYVAYLR